MDFLPINLNIKGLNCLVVGGGNIALRKSKQLLAAGGIVSIVSPSFHDAFHHGSMNNQVKLLTSEYSKKYLADKILVIAATDDSQVNQQVYQDAESEGVLVNVVDQPTLCRFIVPSVIDRSPLTIAISTGGSGPVFARMLREKLEWLLPNNIGEFLTRVNADRTTVAKRVPGLSTRRAFWESFFKRSLGWNAADNIGSSSNQKIDLDYKLFQQPIEAMQAQLALIDFGRSEVEDLSVACIKKLQKADDVYLTHASFQLLKNLIRRDADIHFLEHDILDDQSLVNILTKNSRPSTQTVMVNQGHFFEKFNPATLEGLTHQSALCITRIGIAKY